MKIDKVFTFGCSFSDYMWKVTKPYGHYVAEKLDCKYIHEGAGCGSNSRIFRKFFEYLRNGDINKNTLVTLQFTERSRDEIWYNNVLKEDMMSFNGGISYVEELDNGGIFRYKWDLYELYSDKNLKRIIKDKTDYCYSEEFYTNKTKNIMYSIIEVCKSKNIPFVIINGDYNDNYEDYKNREDLKVVNYRDIQRNYPTYFKETTDYDYSHISQEGHNELGKRILNKLEL